MPESVAGGRRAGRLGDKVAVVTGAARGLGESIAHLFVAEGAKVTVTDIDVERGEDVAARLGPDAHFIAHDVAKEESWVNVLERTTSAFGPPDVLMNNAAISARTPLSELDTADLQRLLAVNLVGPIIGMKVIGGAMKRRGRGSIVNVSSSAGLVGVYPVLAYSTSKWGLRGATKAAAIELGPHGVRVNSLHPGGMVTPMTGHSSYPLAEPPEPGRKDPDPTLAALDAERTYQPIRRMARPIEVARVALFLASDDASYCTGMEFVADGGRTAGFTLESVTEDHVHE